eukprot:1160111-Pelagomonas_calceolata.AAC.8
MHRESAVWSVCTVIHGGVPFSDECEPTLGNAWSSLSVVHRLIGVPAGEACRPVGALAAEGLYDYLVIESSGISEPMQVRHLPSLPIFLVFTHVEVGCRTTHHHSHFAFPSAPGAPPVTPACGLYFLASLLCTKVWCKHALLLALQIAETFVYSLDEAGGAVAPDLSVAKRTEPGGEVGASAGATNTPTQSQSQALRPLSSVARLDTCVTVVDASNMLDRLHSLQTLKQVLLAEHVASHSSLLVGVCTQMHEHLCTYCDLQEQEAMQGRQLSEEDDRNVADLLLEQIEFADGAGESTAPSQDIIVQQAGIYCAMYAPTNALLNKCDTISEEQAHMLSGALTALNPNAHLLRTSNSIVDMRQILNTGKGYAVLFPGHTI